jgi:tetratricopeptide (TPR) repeat protein
LVPGSRVCSYILHTLACVYAEAGKTKEAREVLIQAMDIQNLDEPNSDYWLALGRIAEQYGEREVALPDYARVTSSTQSVGIGDSSYRLAQNRLQVLQNSGQ